jgi:hydroxyacylglutathione hydrolase
MKSHHILHERKLQCRIVQVTPVKQNCSLLWCQETKRAVVVDPGGDIDLLRRVIAEEGVTVERLLVTHGHPDHGGAAAALAAILEVPIEGPHHGDREWIDRITAVGDLHGLWGATSFEPDRWLVDGDEIAVGNQRMVALHCPGHSPGHIAYYSPEARIAFVGDILFRGTIGATGQPRDHLELLRSIRLKLLPLGDDVLFVPGHHVLSTFGEERRSNPFVSDAAAQKYAHYFSHPCLQTPSSSQEQLDKLFSPTDPMHHSGS